MWFGLDQRAAPVQVVPNNVARRMDKDENNIFLACPFQITLSQSNTPYAVHYCTFVRKSVEKTPLALKLERMRPWEQIEYDGLSVGCRRGGAIGASRDLLAQFRSLGTPQRLSCSDYD